MQALMLAACALVAFINIVPYLILGEASIVTYHDQLDGELITYILNAKHLFDGNDTYPELMNGISKNGLMSPAPFFILIFRLFKPFGAFVVCMFIVKLTSMVGMYLLLNELTGKKLISFALACVFTLFPFYTVYGLCIPGQPMLYYSLIALKKKKARIWPYIYAVIYAGCSSLSLVGYTILIGIFAVFIIDAIKKNAPLKDLAFGAVLTFTYALTNLSLVAQALGIKEGFTSHKSEIVRAASGFFDEFVFLLTEGANYAKAYQKYYGFVIVLAVIIGGVWIFKKARTPEMIGEGLISKEPKPTEASEPVRVSKSAEASEFVRVLKSAETSKSSETTEFAGNSDSLKIYTQSKALLLSLLMILILILLTCFTESAPFVAFQNSVGGVFHDFNFNRFSWLLPTLWIVALAFSLSILSDILKGGIKTVIFFILFFVSVGLTAFKSGCDNDLKPNILKILRNGEYDQISWENYYATDLFEEVDTLIGREKSDYRVVSLGIYPAAAAYNGFYCLDAYSNNYDVNYKHEFRKIIAKELDKSDYLKDWYDNWGNRCYLVTNETQNYFLYTKIYNSYITDYDFDLEALKEMGCDYIISALYLIDSEENGLKLLNEQRIESEDSWFGLWVYEIE